MLQPERATEPQPASTLRSSRPRIVSALHVPQVRASQQLVKNALAARRASVSEAEAAARARSAAISERERISLDLRLALDRTQVVYRIARAHP